MVTAAGLPRGEEGALEPGVHYQIYVARLSGRPSAALLAF